ncbi:hypothetical protein EMCG_09334 [[Emmonsia] crescens]|uniref:Uncharacterized protein n=1 Tax=[Emmonsia] crescens TaxID=73230 RepID=A0A0G2J381_9EURO|nr:hypothetical protein EMCG_09334 [Emmonsia crescens UAMH 3008]
MGPRNPGNQGNNNARVSRRELAWAGEPVLRVPVTVALDSYPQLGERTQLREGLLVTCSGDSPATRCLAPLEHVYFWGVSRKVQQLPVSRA